MPVLEAGGIVKPSELERVAWVPTVHGAPRASGGLTGSPVETLADAVDVAGFYWFALDLVYQIAFLAKAND